MINIAGRILGIESPSRQARLKGEDISRKLEKKCIELCEDTTIPMDDKAQVLAEYADDLTRHALDEMKPLHLTIR